MPKAEADGGSLGQGQRIIDPGLARRHVPGRVHEQRAAAEDAAPGLIGDAALGIEVAHPAPGIATADWPYDCQETR